MSQEEKNIAMIQCIKDNNLPAIKILASIGANTQYVELAAEHADTETIKFFIQKNGLDRDYSDALRSAVISNRIHAVELLLECVDEVSDDLLYECASLNLRDVFKLLISKKFNYYI